MVRRPLFRVSAVLGSLFLVGAGNFPDALCWLPHWPSC